MVKIVIDLTSLDGISFGKETITDFIGFKAQLFLSNDWNSSSLIFVSFIEGVVCWIVIFREETFNNYEVPHRISKILMQWLQTSGKGVHKKMLTPKRITKENKGCKRKVV